MKTVKLWFRLITYQYGAVLICVQMVSQNNFREFQKADWKFNFSYVDTINKIILQQSKNSKPDPIN